MGGDRIPGWLAGPVAVAQGDAIDRAVVATAAMKATQGAAVRSPGARHLQEEGGFTSSEKDHDQPSAKGGPANPEE